MTKIYAIIFLTFCNNFFMLVWAVSVFTTILTLACYSYWRSVNAVR